MKFYHYYCGVVAARLASGIVAVVLAASLGQASVAAKPNIVFVLADDMGFG
ncbi:MAG: N-acetylgalactosamine-6-sulfatase, partial [Verrucomicrobia bacterium]|nr:N-acetylgalactosamine-6-sulfatase [Verrucomicrobiota bacterium]